MKLNELKPGQYASITSVYGSGVLRDRLLDMGLTPKTELFLRKSAPMGDPIEITVRGYELTLRKDDAKMIEIQKLDDAYSFGTLCSGNCSSCMKEASGCMNEGAGR